MADETPPTREESATDPAAEAEAGASHKLPPRIQAILGWAVTGKVRKVGLGLVVLTALAGMFATWSYLAQLVVDPVEPVTLQMVLAALDRQDFDEAKSLIGFLQRQSGEQSNLGGALFVLGAVKVHQAESEWSVDRQRATHLIAARYLQKARLLGIPEDRETQSLFLLGQSLIYSNQPQAGIDLLSEALLDESLPSNPIHALLTKANLSKPEPDYAAALFHNGAILSDPSLTSEHRIDAQLQRADILLNLDRTDEVLQLVDEIGESTDHQGRVRTITGRLHLNKALKLPVGAAPRNAALTASLADLKAAQELDPLGGELARLAMYWMGRCYEVQGDEESAIKKFDRLSKQFGDTAEGLVATLAHADLKREAGDAQAALVGYRSVLESVGDPVTYNNEYVPLGSLRKRMFAAHQSFLDDHKFEEAIVLVGHFPKLVGQIDVTSLRAKTHEKWGELKLDQARDLRRREAEALRKEGRHHYRAGGRSYENLAELRFDTQFYTDDTWASAENYFNGQSYKHAARMINQYLDHEVERRKSRALLRLGQSMLATGRPQEATFALQECIELFPRDSDVYQARLVCAEAHLQLDETEKAEQLLMTNLTGDTLTPDSIEWRQSLFALGRLLHYLGRFDEAIKKLEEAVMRYPESSQALFSRYLIARSLHNAAEEPTKKYLTAKVESERQKNAKLRDQYLELALRNYLEVQRIIALERGVDTTVLERTLLRNCYVMEGSVLFQLKRYEAAQKAFSNISTFYQNEPFVLASFVHTANCWRRLDEPMKARGAIKQAQQVLDRLPSEIDFKLTTNFSRQQWELLLNQMRKW